MICICGDLARHPADEVAKMPVQRQHSPIKRWSTNKTKGTVSWWRFVCESLCVCALARLWFACRCSVFMLSYIHIVDMEHCLCLSVVSFCIKRTRHASRPYIIIQIHQKCLILSKQTKRPRRLLHFQQTQTSNAVAQALSDVLFAHLLPIKHGRNAKSERRWRFYSVILSLSHS